MNAKNLRDMITFYAANKSYMVGLNKLLPISQAEGRWTDEQKDILKEVTEIENALTTEESEISISTFISLFKQVLNNRGLKFGVNSYLLEVDERKDENQFLHVYRTYKYFVTYLDEELNQKARKSILTNVEIDEPVPHLNGTSRKLKLMELLKDEDVRNTLKEYPELVDSIVVNVLNEKMKKLNEERRVLDDELIALSKKSGELDKRIDSIKDEIYAINNKKELSLINKSINKFVDIKLEDSEDTIENQQNKEDNKGKEI